VIALQPSRESLEASPCCHGLVLGGLGVTTHLITVLCYRRPMIAHLSPASINLDLPRSTFPIIISPVCAVRLHHSDDGERKRGPSPECSMAATMSPGPMVSLLSPLLARLFPDVFPAFINPVNLHGWNGRKNHRTRFPNPAQISVMKNSCGTDTLTTTPLYSTHPIRGTTGRSQSHPASIPRMEIGGARKPEIIFLNTTGTSS
jgi:hypothetical protein